LFVGAAHRTVGTIDTTITRLGSQDSPALCAFIEELTRIGRHRFFFLKAARRTGYDRLENHLCAMLGLQSTWERKVFRAHKYSHWRKAVIFVAYSGQPNSNSTTSLKQPSSDNLSPTFIKDNALPSFSVAANGKGKTSVLENRKKSTC
jgi:hypothetical protein